MDASEILARVREIEANYENLNDVQKWVHVGWLCAQVERDQARIGELGAGDNPDWDATDGAHPAWWRGHDHTTAVFCREVTEILDGKEPTGVSREPWETLRQRLWALRGQVERDQAELARLREEADQAQDLVDACADAQASGEPLPSAVDMATSVLVDAGAASIQRLCAPAIPVPQPRLRESVAGESAMERAMMVCERIATGRILPSSEIAAAITEAKQAARAAGRAEGIEECAARLAALRIDDAAVLAHFVRSLAAKPPQPRKPEE